MDLQSIVRPRNVSVDLKYDVLCLCTAYPLELGELTT